MQNELLDHYASQNLRIHMVRLPVLASDARDEWNGTPAPKIRVMHFSDGEMEISPRFAKQLEGYRGNCAGCLQSLWA